MRAVKCRRSAKFHIFMPDIHVSFGMQVYQTSKTRSILSCADFIFHFLLHYVIAIHQRYRQIDGRHAGSISASKSRKNCITARMLWLYCDFFVFVSVWHFDSTECIFRRFVAPCFGALQHSRYLWRAVGELRPCCWIFWDRDQRYIGA